MPSAKALFIRGKLSIPLSEIELGYSRSGGAGGQNVNKVNTKVSLHFNVDLSPSLTVEQKKRIAEILANRISREGLLHLSASEHRSQGDNRTAVLERFVSLIRYALSPPPRQRKATKPSRRAIEKRLEAKRRRSLVKQQRNKVD